METEKEYPRPQNEPPPPIAEIRVYKDSGDSDSVMTTTTASGTKPACQLTDRDDKELFEEEEEEDRIYLESDKDLENMKTVLREFSTEIQTTTTISSNEQSETAMTAELKTGTTASSNEQSETATTAEDTTTTLKIEKDLKTYVRCIVKGEGRFIEEYIHGEKTRRLLYEKVFGTKLEIAHGALITPDSKADIVCVDEISKEMKDVELKNNKDFSLNSGIRQCSGYLLNQLCYLRTQKKFNIKAVCGIVVCGPECQGVSDITIGIVVISLPQQIGGRFQRTVFVACDKTIGLKALKIALNHRFYDVSELKTNLLKISTTGEILMPSEFYEKPNISTTGEILIPSDLLSIWKVVETGTGNLVFKYTPDPKDEKVLKGALEFIDRLECDHDANSDLKKFINDNKGKTMYMKIKNRMSGISWRSPLTKIKKWNLYPDKSLVAFRSDYNIIILMTEMGSHLDETNKPTTLRNFCTKYLKLMKDTLEVAKGLVHGDIHEGNLVYENGQNEEDRNLRFIDWDEAVGRHDKIERPELDRYPNFIFNKKNEFTMVQLVLLFCDLSKLYGQELVYERDGNEELVIRILNKEQKKSEHKEVRELFAVEKLEQKDVPGYFNAFQNCLEAVENVPPIPVGSIGGSDGESPKKRKSELIL